MKRLKKAREKNKEKFDNKYGLQFRAIQNDNWILVYDNSLDNQHNTLMKFIKEGFGPYLVR